MSGAYAIGVDVGGTKIAAGLVALSEGKVLARRLAATQPERGGEAVLAGVIEQIRSLQEEARRLGIQPAAIGIGVAELVSTGGILLSDATIRWKDLNVCEAIQNETGLPAYLEADVRAAARAEAHLGAGRGLGSFLYVTIGTGISSCLVLSGVPYAGARGLTGTFASSRGLIPGDDGELVGGPPLEQFAAGPALAARFNAIRSDRCYTAPEVIDLCEAGDPSSRSIVRTAGLALGAAVAQLVNVLDPEIVVIGGGLGLAGGHYRQSLQAGLRDYVWSEHHRDIPLATARLGEDAGLIGAALAATER